MTPVFCCGFECGQIAASSHWSAFSGSPAISTTTVRNGARSLRLNPAAATIQARTTLTSSNSWVFRGYLRFASLPTADCTMVVLGSVAGIMSFQIADGKLYSARGGVISATGVLMELNRWYRIDMYNDGTAGTVKAQIDGNDLGDVTAGGTGSATVVGLGPNSSNTFDAFFDDIIVSNTLADYPIGTGYVNHFVPTSDGTHNVAGTGDFQRTLTGTDILNATTTAFQLVDDVPLESGASVDWINMVAPPNATDYVECVFGAASGITTPIRAPRAVEVIAGIHQAGATAGNMEIRVNDNGTNDNMYTASAVVGTTTV